MRTLLLLRGSAGCGKSLWIETHHLENYTISADKIRLLYSAPIFSVPGKEQINQTNNGRVWKLLFELLEIRMEKGEFVVIDATNSRVSEINQYKSLCEKYRYKAFCVDFTDIPAELAKARNRMRPEAKQVPGEVIDEMYARFKEQKIPPWVTIIKPNKLNDIWEKQIDLNHYKKIHHIGDIHGCYTPLIKYFSENGGIKEDEFYIFCGDYLDRGKENVEVVNFLLSIYRRPNVCLLEGNHEKHLWNWINNKTANSKEFEHRTKIVLEDAEIDKKRIRKLFNEIKSCLYYTYSGNSYLVTHGGLSVNPKNLTLVSTEQLIHGIGSHADAAEVARSFACNAAENCYQIHGHRNPDNLPICVHDRTYNLEGKVEFDGCLRCLQVTPNRTHKEIEWKT